MAFLTILLLVNTGLIAIEELVVYADVLKEDRPPATLRPLMY